MNSAIGKTTESNSRNLKSLLVHLRQMPEPDCIDLLVKTRLLSPRKATAAKRKLAKSWR